MARRVDGSLGTQLQGVSQQPAKERLPGQVTEQINMTSDVVQMLRRRPPAELVFEDILGTSTNVKDAFFHFYSRGDDEKYFILVLPNSSTFHVFDEFGVLQAKDNQTGSYLNVPNPREQLSATTVGDYTFITNKTINTALTSTGTETWTDKTSRITCEIGQYSRSFQVTVKEATRTYQGFYDSPASTDANAEHDAGAGWIADQLRISLINDTAGGAIFFDRYDDHSKGGFDSGRGGFFVDASTFVIVPKFDQEYTVSATDNTGGQSIKTISNRTVTSISQLPATELPNSVYWVRGGNSEADDFYMKFDAGNTVSFNDYFATGVWVETEFPGTANREFDATTMPHMIIRGSTGTFVGGPAGTVASGVTIDPWATRLVGDVNSNPPPNFVGGPIHDIVAFQDRLVFISPEDVTMSVTGDFFNFWKKTAITLLDDAPLGVASNSGTVNTLRFAEQHDRNLIVFADNAQFLIPGSVALTPSNITMTESTRFVIASTARPVPSGQNLFFAVDSGVFSGIREFYTDNDLNSNNSRPTTIQVEKFIPGPIRYMASSTDVNKLVVVADEDNALFLYEYLWEGSDQLQSAWSKWTFRDDVTVLFVQFIESTLYMVVGRFDGNYRLDLLSIDMSHDIDEFELGGAIIMDYRTANVVVDDKLTSMFYLDDGSSDKSRLIAIQGAGCPNPGMVAHIKAFNDGTDIIFSQSMGGGTVYVGLKYRSSVKPTMPFVRDDSNRPITTAKLTVNDMFVNFIASGDFNVDVISEVGYSYTERNPGRVLGQASATLGQFVLTSGQFPVAVREENTAAEIEVYTDGPYPMTISDIEWNGQYHHRGTRITRPGG